ncbi:MAG: hypothetical protein GX611_03175 [Clostridiales bacterium]|nr:hypothetical protein [Clostridiales bacterium]
MTMPSLIGLHLEEALQRLRDQGITPEVVFSMPERPMSGPEGRAPRVVRFQNNQLLCSYFRDADPEAATCKPSHCPDT